MYLPCFWKTIALFNALPRVDAVLFDAIVRKVDHVVATADARR